MNKETFIHILFMVIGIYSILGAYFEWNFFYNNRKAERVINLFGRSGAKIFYIVVGLVLFSIAFLDMTNVIDIHLLFGRRAAIQHILNK